MLALPRLTSDPLRPAFSFPSLSELLDANKTSDFRSQLAGREALRAVGWHRLGCLAFRGVPFACRRRRRSL